MHAACNNDLESVKSLIKDGANVHVDEGYCIRNAAGNGHLEIVKYLISNGAKISSQGGYPIVCASRNGHLDVVKLLVKEGCVIWEALAKAKDLKIIKYLEGVMLREKRLKELAKV